MLSRRFFRVPVRLISRSSVQAKAPSSGSSDKRDKINLGDTVKVPVETNTQKLLECVCGTNLLCEGGEDVKIKPDSEYPDWLWSIRSTQPLEEMDKNSKNYWNRVRKQRQKEEKNLLSIRRNATVHK